MPQSAAGFGRRYRLLNSAQFRKVFDKRQSTRGRFFSVHVAGNRGEHPRLGLTVSRKVSKRAVERNRIKRQIRESFRLNRDSLPSADFVVVSKPGAAGVAGQELREDLDRLWSKRLVQGFKPGT